MLPYDATRRRNANTDFPQYNRYGIFRLTNPPGLPHILQCTQQATFHQHAVDNLYTGAENPPGHVHESRKLSFEVQDLRPGFSSNSSSNSGNGGGGTVPRKNF